MNKIRHIKRLWEKSIPVISCIFHTNNHTNVKNISPGNELRGVKLSQNNNKNMKKSLTNILVFDSIIFAVTLQDCYGGVA